MDDITKLESLPVEQLIKMIREKTGAGVNLSFPGKVLARQIGRRVRPRNQRTVNARSAGDERGRSRNLLIEGDNLQALASLYRERGQVDMILTDPPYNTGDDFRYNDKWDTDPNDPDMGEFVGSDDPAKHTKWMKFMYPRLQMMRAMLKPSGVLAICIDSRELFHLGQMLDELFGEENRLAIINWQKTAAPRSDKDGITATTEYVLVYARDYPRVKTSSLERTEADNRRYGNPDSDSGGLWREGNLTARTWSENSDYAIQSPFTGEFHYPAGEGAWRHPKRNIKEWVEQWGSTYCEKLIDDGKVKALVLKEGFGPEVVKRAKKRLSEREWPFIWFGRDGLGRPRTKTFLEKIKKGKVPVTYWADEELDFPVELGSTSWDFEESGRSSDGSSELTSVVGKGHGFTTVKPLKLMMKLIQLWAPDQGTVLDPFAGSGTTGHAVLALNHMSGSDRRFILVEQGRPERGDPYARALTAERLQKVVNGNWFNGKGHALGGGFTFKVLEKKVDSKTLLLMERDEMIDTVIASHSSTGNRRSAALITVCDENEPYVYLVAKNASNEGIYLVWSGPGSNTDFTEEVYEAITEEAEAAGLTAVFHVYSRRNLIVTDDVVWYQIPDRILSDFGLDVRTESFTEER
ncbi:site-specific DNA-methyltransferase [Vreelandella sp. V005]|uniref:site-specific DNA-methyltransferase n=1 Tax=Vreelandella sp. V005 TaxID=3459608 RepID=UPI004043C416